MNTDKELTCSDKQAVSAAGVSTDSIILKGRLGMARTSQLRAVAQVEGVTTPGDLTVELIQADNAALTAGVVALASQTKTGITSTTQADGRRFDFVFPEVTKDYFGFRYTPAGGGSFTVFAGLVAGSESPLSNRGTFNSHGF